MQGSEWSCELTIPNETLNAQRAAGLRFAGDPLPIPFESRCLMRNDRVTRAIPQPAGKSSRLRQ